MTTTSSLYSEYNEIRNEQMLWYKNIDKDVKVLLEQSIIIDIILDKLYWINITYPEMNENKTEDQHLNSINFYELDDMCILKLLSENFQFIYKDYDGNYLLKGQSESGVIFGCLYHIYDNLLNEFLGNGKNEDNNLLNEGKLLNVIKRSSNIKIKCPRDYVKIK